MTYERTDFGVLDYYPCRYDMSRMTFRGPKRKLQGEYIAFLGGTEIYGRFLRDPVPALVEKAIGKTCVNFGAPNAGLDAYLNEPAILAAAQKATVCAVQVMGAANMSNQYYTVHPRRNDRFLKASLLLKELYYEVDFTEFNFNQHMLKSLRSLSSERFDIIREELRSEWVARMKNMIESLRTHVVLLWFSERRLSENAADTIHSPLFVDGEMIHALQRSAFDLVEVVPSAQALRLRTDGMVITETERPVAAKLMGPLAHQEAAESLLPVLSKFLKN